MHIITNNYISLIVNNNLIHYIIIYYTYNDESECNGDTKIMISTLRLYLLHLYTHIYS